MRKVTLIICLSLLPVLGFTQFKSQTKLPSLSQVIAKPSNGLIFGFIDPSKLSMQHNLSMSYMSFGKAGGMMVNSYMNTINYQISDPLFLRVNLGIMNSPYNSLQNPVLNNTQFFGGAELFYRPSENSLIKLGFDIRPGYYGPGYYSNDLYGW